VADVGVEPATLAWESNAQPLSQLDNQCNAVHKTVAIYYNLSEIFTDIKVK